MKEFFKGAAAIAVGIVFAYLLIQGGEKLIDNLAAANVAKGVKDAADKAGTSETEA